MDTSIKSVAPTPRCYVCGDTDIRMICHECGRPMCDDHGPATHLQRFFDYWLKENSEFDDLSLEDAGINNTGVHCEYCVHAELSESLIRRLIIAGTTVVFLVMLLGVLLITDLMSQGLFLTSAVASVLIGYMVLEWISERLYKARQKRRPPLPVAGQIRAAEVHEAIYGKVQLRRNGKYQSESGTLSGTLTLRKLFSEADRLRLVQYHRKYPTISLDSVDYHAGFIIFHSLRERLSFEAPYESLRDDTYVLPLKEKIYRAPALTSDRSRTKRWNVSYSFTESRSVRIPLQIIPTVVDEGPMHAIELVFQWDTNTKLRSNLKSMERIEELLLYIPHSFGEIEFTDPASKPLKKTPKYKRREWKDLFVSADEQRERRKSVTLRFHQEIDPEAVLDGTVKARFDGTISGIDTVYLFDPLGDRLQTLRENQTILTLDFKLSLNKLHAHSLKQVTCPQLSVENVVPDSNLVVRLIDKLTEQGCYVKRVIENPPYTSRQSANMSHRYWDIAGRRYLGVYPVDFHVILAGTEVNRRAEVDAKDETRVEIIVQGFVTGQPMQAELVSQLKDLVIVTWKVLTGKVLTPDKVRELCPSVSDAVEVEL